MVEVFIAGGQSIRAPRAMRDDEHIAVKEAQCHHGVSSPAPGPQLKALHRFCGCIDEQTAGTGGSLYETASSGRFSAELYGNGPREGIRLDVNRSWAETPGPADRSPVRQLAAEKADRKGQLKGCGGQADTVRRAQQLASVLSRRKAIGSISKIVDSTVRRDLEPGAAPVRTIAAKAGPAVIGVDHLTTNLRRPPPLPLADSVMTGLVSGYSPGAHHRHPKVPENHRAELC